jgi:hypothetical protein
MTKKDKEAIELVERFNQWRRGRVDNYETNPKSIGEAIDRVVKLAREINNQKKMI